MPTSTSIQKHASVVKIKSASRKSRILGSLAETRSMYCCLLPCNCVKAVKTRLGFESRPTSHLCWLRPAQRQARPLTYNRGRGRGREDYMRTCVRVPSRYRVYFRSESELFGCGDRPQHKAGCLVIIPSPSRFKSNSNTRPQFMQKCSDGSYLI